MNEIQSLCPEYLRDIYEIKYLCKALDRGFGQMETNLSALLAGATLYRSETVSMGHWKKMLEGGDKLYDMDAHEKLLERLAMDENVNFEFITKYLDKECSYSGHETSFDPDAMLLTVKTTAGFYVREEAEKYLREVLPCNIELKIVTP